ncbi:transporter [Flavobacterium sp.]|jgi:hypothetical protein|uniref:transporter n=1 Tax=Flavobacterium sp. TaxID=239 RepID=UPI0037C104AD
MKKIKKLLHIAFVFSFSSLLAQHTDMINSNRPGLSMAAFSVGKNVFQLESGIYGIREDHNLSRYNSNGFGVDLDLRYGFLFEQLEVIGNFKYQYDKYYSPLVETSRSGFRSTTFGAKYLIYDPFKKGEDKPNLYSWKANHKFKWKQFIPAVGVYVGMNFGFANEDYAFPDEPSMSPKVMVIAQNHFGTRWVLVTNIFYDKFTTDYKSLGYILTLTRGFNQKWSGFIENQGIKGDYYSDSIFRIGAAYLLQNNLQVDASISKNFKDTPDILYGGVGVSWRFDKKYKPVKIETDEEGGKRVDKKKKDKKTKEAKKRADEVEG